MADEAGKQKNARDEMLARLLEKAAVVKRTFATEDGQKCLELLRREFALSLEAKEPEGIIFKAGRADAYNWIMQMVNLTPDGR